jgi:hypothetical protein
MDRTNPEIPRATNREWFGLAALALPCLLCSMDLTVLNLAVPKLSAAGRPSGYWDRTAESSMNRHMTNETYMGELRCQSTQTKPKYVH